MIAHLMKAIGQLSDPGTRRVFWKAVLGSLLADILLAVLLYYLLQWGAGLINDWAAATGWLRTVLDFVLDGTSFLVITLLMILAFPAAVSIILPMLLDEVCNRVEARHYPSLSPADEQPVLEALIDGLRLAALTLGINFLLLPLYLIFLFIPPLNLLLFYAVNGYLLGREYFELAAVRRLTSKSARLLRKKVGGRVIVAGVIIAFFLTIPLVNLLTPIIAAAMMVHLFQEERVQSLAVTLEGRALDKAE
ncbi:EI24 domain-containing protein [Rhodovibrionaceae bacterium A322]